MAKRLTGINPLAYLGVDPSMPSNTFVSPRAPTDNDNANFNIGDLWIKEVTKGLWILADKTPNATNRWVQLSSETTDLNSLTGDIGAAVGPTAGNINIIGNPGSPYSVAGNPATSTLTIDDDGTVLGLFTTDGGFATPAANTIAAVGGNVVETDGSGSTLTISLTNGSNGQVLLGGGSDPVWASITSTGGTVTITPGANTLNLEVAGAVSNIEDLTGDTGTATGSSVEIAGGNNITTAASGATVTVNVSGTTQYALQTGAADGSLADLGPATTGQIPIGVTGGSMNLATLTAGANINIDDTSIPGQIEISASGAAGSGIIVNKYVSDTTWMKDPSTKMVTIIAWGGGNGGGSGSKTTAGATVYSGGGGGTDGGGFYYPMIPADLFGASETVRVGAGGAGGAAVSTDSTAGNNGSLGGASQVGSLISTPGSAGPGGEQPGASSGKLAPRFWNLAAGLGTTAQVTSLQAGRGGFAGPGQDAPSLGAGSTNAFGGRYPTATCGGGGGAPLASGSSEGGFGGYVYALDDTTVIFLGGSQGLPSVGSEDGGNGVNALTSAAGGILCGGTGGGGGAGQNTAAGTLAGSGGNGGIPGGGGGGGGAAINGAGAPSGAGGDGGRGEVWIIEYL